MDHLSQLKMEVSNQKRTQVKIKKTPCFIQVFPYSSILKHFTGRAGRSSSSFTKQSDGLAIVWAYVGRFCNRVEFFLKDILMIYVISSVNITIPYLLKIKKKEW